MDMMYNFTSLIWGKEIADWTSTMMEYMPHSQEFDPFSAMYNISSQYHLPIPTTGY